jgi:hypothetical protein
MMNQIDDHQLRLETSKSMEWVWSKKEDTSVNRRRRNCRMSLEDRRMCGHFGLAGQRTTLRNSPWLVEQLPTGTEIRQDLLQTSVGIIAFHDDKTIALPRPRQQPLFTSDTGTFPTLQTQKRPFKLLFGKDGMAMAADEYKADHNILDIVPDKKETEVHHTKKKHTKKGKKKGTKKEKGKGLKKKGKKKKK